MIIFKITRKASYICVDYEKFLVVLSNSGNKVSPQLSYIKYKDIIIFDKNYFLDNIITLYFQEDRKNVKNTKEFINSKKEIGNVGILWKFTR